MGLFSKPELAVLFVCTANICRSPMAEGMLREELKLAGAHKRVLVDSAGINASQPGHHADGRARQVCARQGIDLRRCRARQVVAADFERFDYLVALDSSHRSWLVEQSPRHLINRISCLGEWAPGKDLGDIPDPYYGNVAGFETVLASLHSAFAGFVPHLMKRLRHG